MTHSFRGKWISDAAMAALPPRNVFHRQLCKLELDTTEYRGRHILFRRRFSLLAPPTAARLYITADDHYKLYINGSYVAEGPSPSYHFRHNYNEIDVTPYLRPGENVIAVHTLYQGLINRVWQSGDLRHGLLCDLDVDGETLLSSDESFLTAPHTGYSEMGVCGYATQLLERYDSRAREVGFEQIDFDDSAWGRASLCRFEDHTLLPQASHMLVEERIAPVFRECRAGRLLLDFGALYVGYLSVTARGRYGDSVTVRCAQELLEDGMPRYRLRANCRYEEEWILSGGEDTLSWFDYKSFRYAELLLPEGVTVTEVHLVARHYPFTLRARLLDEYAEEPALERLFALCVHTQRYGVQEIIGDCMEREKGFYLGDGCYTALTHMLLTGDDTMVRKLIDDAFAASAFCDTLVTCLDCSFMQEIAEYPLILVSLLLWHYRYTGDLAYLSENYGRAVALLDAYRRDYEEGGLLRHLDKWCVVEWPPNFRDGYAVDIREGEICHEAHVAINAYYLYALRTLNEIASILEKPPYRDEAPLLAAFLSAFYDKETGLFFDGEEARHHSLVGNVFAYAFDLCPDAHSRDAILAMIDRRGIAALSLFCTFPLLAQWAREGDRRRIREALLHPDAWQRMLREGATATFEGWGKDTKWNTSLFHLTMSYAAVFLVAEDLPHLLG